MAEFSIELIQNTIDVWSPKYGYTLSEDEAVEIIQNLTRYFETLDDIAKSIARDITKELIDDGTFTKCEEIDNLVPDKTGLYCIRLRDDATLPEQYQAELDKRNSRLIYIGKAEKKTLQKRFLRQELRAKGHGTFFRSVGAMLGFTPPEGSLKDKKNRNNYKFSKADEARIIEWINLHLEANWKVFDDLFVIEKYLISMHRPLLNIKENPQALSLLIKARDKCKRIAIGYEKSYG